jgi:hypothetical protein
MPILRRHLFYDVCDQACLKCFRNSRPPSMVPFVETGDESMSEGDESDNVDLTDGSSYNSDGSEWTQGIFFLPALSRL